LIFFGIGYGLFRIFGEAVYLTVGFAGAFGTMLLSLVADMRDIVTYRAKKTYPGVDEIRAKASSAARSFAGSAFSAACYICTFPFIMNVITGTAIIDFAAGTRLIGHVLLFYSIAMNAVWILRFGVFILRKQADEQ
jgi:hypothetical protein